MSRILSNLLAATIALPVSAQEFNLWVVSDPHVLSDLAHSSASPFEPYGRESLGKAIRHALGQDGQYNWPAIDAVLMLGDVSATQGAPTDAEGQEYVRQLGTGGALLPRSRFYALVGNHDATPGQEWAIRWLDPCGTNPAESGIVNAERPFPITAPCSPLAYRVDMGNLTILMLSDRNEGLVPHGRFLPNGTYASGGRPAGAVQQSTVDWWQAQVADARAANRLVVTTAHHMLRETTAWTADGEACAFHNCTTTPEDAEGGAYLYFLLNGEQYTSKAQVFEQLLAASPGLVDMWIGGHTHADPRVADPAGRTHSESVWGVHFINAAGLTRYHGAQSYPRSVLLTFTANSNLVRVRPFWHSTRAGFIGWDTEREQTLSASRPFIATEASPPCTCTCCNGSAGQ